MKSSKLEFFYLFLSLVLLGFSTYIYLIHNPESQASVTGITSALNPKSNTSQNTNKEEKANYTSIQTKLNDISNNPSYEAINSLRAEIETLGDSPEKTNFLDVLSSLELDLTIITTIEENLILAEQTAIIDYFSAAQTGIDSLTSESKKNEFQNRLNTIYTDLTGMTWMEQ